MQTFLDNILSLETDIDQIKNIPCTYAKYQGAPEPRNQDMNDCFYQTKSKYDRSHFLYSSDCTTKCNYSNYRSYYWWRYWFRSGSAQESENRPLRPNFCQKI